MRAWPQYFSQPPESVYSQNSYREILDFALKSQFIFQKFKMRRSALVVQKLNNNP